MLPFKAHRTTAVFRLLASLALLAVASNTALAQSYGVARDNPAPTLELAELSADQVTALMREEVWKCGRRCGGKRATPLSATTAQACTQASKAGLHAWTQASAVAPDKFSFKASFANGSAQISAADMADLAKLAAGMKQSDLADFQFLIEGHANKTGTAAQNYNISCQRAINMRTVLIERYGVPASRIDVVGLGFDELIPERDETDAAHRRAEFRYRRR